MIPSETVLLFLERINQRDPAKLAELMTEDHGSSTRCASACNRESMRQAWQAYFAFCPDYWTSHQEILAEGNLVAVFGAAGGTISVDGKLSPENRWEIPAAWRAVVQNGLVKEWQVYADNKPVYDILAKHAN
ncbi:MAG TPA: nuclear transport factor 2 family protein [Bryobacteraceae bacterium]|nr:nuclear transport factor 2 family protein [Bryobacteraceae bacterium]